MSQNPSRQHHYVPKGYMAPWAGSDGHVTVYTRGNRDHVSVTRRAPTSVMYMLDLYADASFEATSHEAHHLEKTYLQKLDSDGAKLQRAMIAGHPLSSASDRETWTRFLVALLFRHPDDVGKLRKVHAIMWKEHEDAAVAEMRHEMAGFDPIWVATEYFKSWRAGQEAQRVRSLRQMMDYGLVGKVLNNGRWGVLDFTKVKDSLVLSDKPVFRSGTFRAPGDYIALPIGPKHLFVCAYGNRLVGALPFEPSAAVLRRLNSVLVGQASRFVVTDEGARHDWIGKRIGREPTPSLTDIMGEPFGL